MARQQILMQELRGPYDASYPANSADITFTLAIVADKEALQISCPILVLVKNVNVGAKTVTFNSVVDRYNRTLDVTTYSIAAGSIAAFEFKPHGWKQTDGFLYAEAEHIDVSYAVLKKG
jgi:hypothetical protein